MNWPLTRGPVDRAPLPFNLSRWFAIVGLVSITIVGSASALMLTYFLTDRMLQQEGQMTMQFVQSLVTTETSLPDYFNGVPTKDSNELEMALKHIAAVPDTLRANMYNRNHVLIWSSDSKLIGRRFGANAELDRALAGQLVVHADDEDPTISPHKEEHVNLKDEDDYFIEVYVPVRDAPHGKVIGVVELYKSPKALAEALHTGRIYIIFGAVAAGLFLYLTLFWLSRRADAVIRSQQEQLLESQILATVGEMGSAVAHGIRNPLAAIRSSAELALDSPPELVRETAQDIIAEADRLEAWVRNLLSYARPLAGAHEAVALPALVDGAFEHFAREMEKRNISRSCSIAHDLPMARGDSFLLGQVLHSLLANAMEAIEQGGSIEVASAAVPARRRVELTVRDSGPGMTPEQLKRVFTPFYTTKPKGLGVGLALAKRIVERFGGHIHIDSAPGRGTAVCLSMPTA
ncbi:MAG: two-component sensor histidine kinase [Burkholderiales bacterium]|nr:two-component sensor histidine kinase [Burkholderiales bacterium]